MVEIDSNDYQHTFYGILNGDGKFWTPMPFDSEAAARKALDEGRKTIGRMDNHRVVPVRIRLTTVEPMEQDR